MELKQNEDFKCLVERTRSYRRFDESQRVGEDFLRDMVDLARICSNGANRQRLRFRIVADEAGCADVFRTLAWAAALKDWPGPSEGERPTGYVIICAERPAAGKPAQAVTEIDAGIAAHTMLLAARTASPSVVGCMFKAFKPSLVDVLGIDSDRYELKLVVAFGIPAEEVRLEPLAASPDGSTDYWRDAAGVHHVPKRSLEDVLI